MDYYGARYYDPVAGVFLAADTVDGNGSGDNPYSYVGGNPETFSDPTGNIGVPLYQITQGQKSATMPGWAVVAMSVVLAPADAPPEAIAILIGLGIWGSESHPPSTSLFGNGKIDMPALLGLGTLSGNATSPITGLLSGNVGRPPATQTGDSGRGTVPPAPPVSSTPPSDENPDISRFGKLTNRNIRVSECGISIIEKHLSHPDFTEPDGLVAPENLAMIQRLKAAFAEGRTISSADASFYMHEIYESMLMDQGMSYEAAHLAAFERYGVSQFSVYDPEVIQAFPRSFNTHWFAFWDITTGDTGGDAEC